jgi:iron complex transport system ATP-binding protein
VSELPDILIIATKAPYYAYSSGVLGDGVQWADLYYNRYVDKNYHAEQPEREFTEFLNKKGLKTKTAVGFMTAVQLRRRLLLTWHDPSITVTALITAGTGNAVDITKKRRWESDRKPGTINMFFFIEGTLTEAAFLQTFISATEAKTKALADFGIQDPYTNTAATGTSTDGICVAASQKGPLHAYGGPITPLGSAVAQLVYTSLSKALEEA